MKRIRICLNFTLHRCTICININYLILGPWQTTLGFPLSMSSAFRLLCAPTQTTWHAFLHVHSYRKASACAIRGSSLTKRMTPLEMYILSLPSMNSKLIFMTFKIGGVHPSCRRVTDNIKLYSIEFQRRVFRFDCSLHEIIYCSVKNSRMDRKIA